MGGDLPGRRAVDSLLALVILHLLTARTRCLQILPRVALDLRLAVLAALQLVAELLQACGQLRAIDRRTVVLRGVQLMRLHGAGLAILALGHVEDHGMGVELRRGVAIDGPRRVVLEGRGGELSCGLRGMHVADPRLGVVLDLAQSHTNALPVRLPHPLIPADKRRERNRLRRGEAIDHHPDFALAGQRVDHVARVGIGGLSCKPIVVGGVVEATRNPPQVSGSDSRWRA